MRVPPHQQQQRSYGHGHVETDAKHRWWRSMFGIAYSQGQKNQPARQRQNKQQRRIVVQHVNRIAEDMPAQQDQAQ